MSQQYKEYPPVSDKQLGFFIDSSRCSGCKACQVACKDKHNLEVGRRFRRVYEVKGGGFIPTGQGGYTNNVFAFTPVDLLQPLRGSDLHQKLPDHGDA